jgi:hypothetical protein
MGYTAEVQRAPVLATSTAIVLGAAAVVAAIGVRGDFPLNDDWSYAWAARTLCHEGHLRLLPWTGASVLAQIAYGAGVCRLFGFSFTVLRASTLVLATVGVLAWHALLRRIGVRGAMLAVATVVLALDPLYVNLAFTFMTDVPFTVVTVLAGWWYLRGIQERRQRSLVVAAVLAAIALLIRQHGVFLVAAAGLAIAVWDDRPPSRRLAAVLAATLVPCMAFLGYHLWLFALHGAPPGYTNKLGEARQIGALMLVNCAFRGTQYLGLLAAPLAPALLRDALARRPRQLAAWTVALGLLALALWVREGALLFHLPNVLYDFGVGPVSLRDTQVLGMPAPTQLGLALRLPLTIVATLSAAALCTAASAAVGALRAGSDASHAWSSGADRAPWSTNAETSARAFLLLAAGLLFVGTLLQSRYYFDRYLLPVLPFAVAAVLAVVRVRAPTRAGAVLAAALAWLALAGTHDYLAWNRARFAGLADLERAGVAPTEIDGGFEFDAWRLAPLAAHWPSDEEVRVGQAADRRSWWWVVDDRYVVSFHELPGYTIREAVPFTRWLVPGRGRVLVLERAPRA